MTATPGVPLLDVRDLHVTYGTRNVGEGIITVDGDGCVRYMNHAAATLLGWTEDELRGKPMHGAIHFQQADGTLCPDEDCPMVGICFPARPIFDGRQHPLDEQRPNQDLCMEPIQQIADCNKTTFVGEFISDRAAGQAYCGDERCSQVQG